MVTIIFLSSLPTFTQGFNGLIRPLRIIREEQVPPPRWQLLHNVKGWEDREGKGTAQLLDGESSESCLREDTEKSSLQLIFLSGRALISLHLSRINAALRRFLPNPLPHAPQKGTVCFGKEQSSANPLKIHRAGLFRLTSSSINPPETGLNTILPLPLMGPPLHGCVTCNAADHVLGPTRTQRCPQNSHYSRAMQQGGRARGFGAV